jgi:phage antirepressor YoqD-like protein
MQSLKGVEKRAILKLLIWLATRDGETSEQELAFIESTALQLQIDPLPPLKVLKVNDIQPILLDLNTAAAKQFALESLIKMSFADGVYDARERIAVGEAAKILDVPWSTVENIEHELVERLRDTLAEANENANASKETENTIQDPKAWDWKKIAQVAGMTVVGGVAIGATGGLAAPIIGGAIGTTFLGLSGAAATSAGLAFLGGGSLAAGGLGMAGGTTLVTAALGAGGAGVAGWKANHRLGDIKEWDIEHIGGEGLHICLGISGFLQQGEQSKDVWSALQQSFPKACSYDLKWESKKQQDLFKVLTSISSKGLSGAATAQLAMSATKKAFGMAALPVAALSALDIIDNPWGVAKNRAEQAGRHLGDYIADGGFGGLSITLVGYSLGTRVIVAALDQLAKRGVSGKIFDVYLLAGAVAQNDPRLEQISQVVEGKIVNVYSEKDLVLAYVYRTAEWLARPIGMSKLELDGVLNLDVTDWVGGHINYKTYLPQILSEVNALLGRSHQAASKAASESTSNLLVKALRLRLNEVPGMTEANRADFQYSKPLFRFQNGVQVNTWKNPFGVDHVFIRDENERCVYGGYVGWIHSSGLEVTLQTMQRDFAKDLA